MDFLNKIYMLLPVYLVAAFVAKVGHTMTSGLPFQTGGYRSAIFVMFLDFVNVLISLVGGAVLGYGLIFVTLACAIYATINVFRGRFYF